jgi:hypothetical protein
MDCCFGGVLGGIGTAVSSEASDATTCAKDKANQKLDKVAGGAQENGEQKIDNALEKALATGSNLIFNSKQTFDQIERDKQLKKTKKNMDSIRNKYQPQPQAKKVDPNTRKSYEDLKSKLQH